MLLLFQSTAVEHQFTAAGTATSSGSAVLAANLGVAASGSVVTDGVVGLSVGLSLAAEGVSTSSGSAALEGGQAVGSFVDADASSLTTSVTTLTGVTWPAHNADDVAVVGWASDNTQTRTEPPSTFTSEFTNADGSLRAIVASKDSTGSESGDVSLVCGGANRQAGVIALYRGYNANITNVTSQAETSGTAVTSHNSPSITPADSGSAIVLIYMDRVSSSVVPTAPAGYTVRGSFATGGSGGTTVVVADKLTGLTAGVPESPAAWTGATSSTTAYVIALELVPSTTEQSLTAAGTATSSGSAPLSLTQVLAAAGSSASDGAVALGVSAPLSASGAAATTGSAPLGVRLAVTASGAATSDGTAALSAHLPLAAAGSATTTGSAALDLVPGATSYPLTASGSAASTGSASLTAELILAASGSAVSDGTAPLSSVLVLSASGSAESSGSADLQLFSPITPRPNTGTTVRIVGVPTSTPRPTAGITPRP